MVTQNIKTYCKSLRKWHKGFCTTTKSLTEITVKDHKDFAICLQKLIIWYFDDGFGKSRVRHQSRRAHERFVRLRSEAVATVVYMVYSGRILCYGLSLRRTFDFISSTNKYRIHWLMYYIPKLSSKLRWISSPLARSFPSKSQFHYFVSIHID